MENISPEQLHDEVKKIFGKHGRKGGLIVKKKYGLRHFSKIGKLAAKKRWSGHNKKVDNSI